MNKFAAGEVIVCAGAGINRECARVMADLGQTGQWNKYRFVMREWITTDQFCKGILLWITDNSAPWDDVYFALSYRIPLLVAEGNVELTQLCIGANYGIWYRDEADARLCLEYLLSSDAIRERLGAHGQAYLSASNISAQLQHSLAARTNNHSGD